MRILCPLYPNLHSLVMIYVFGFSSTSTSSKKNYFSKICKCIISCFLLSERTKVHINL
nr:MAG TPA: hypothetical protein [Caudoviricetes sp.]